MPEAKLAREAELPYSTLAFVTDYDCWNESEAGVSADLVLTTLGKNAELAPRIVLALAANLPDAERSPAFGVLKNSIITDRSQTDPMEMARLKWLLGAEPIVREGQL